MKKQKCVWCNSEIPRSRGIDDYCSEFCRRRNSEYYALDTPPMSYYDQQWEAK